MNDSHIASAFDRDLEEIQGHIMKMGRSRHPRRIQVFEKP
jgi:hypothetical protein